MNFYMIEGTIQNAKLMNEARLQEHIAYTQKAMEKDMILLSGLKSDESGGIFVMKANSREEIENYLLNEPFQTYGIQSYRVIPFTPHYVNKVPERWN